MSENIEEDKRIIQFTITERIQKAAQLTIENISRYDS